MKRILLAAAVVLGLAVVIVAAVSWSRPSTHNTIIEMAGKGATESEMLSAVDKGAREPLNADDVIKLNKAGVPNNVVSALLHQAGTR
jgi:hypothetical protein